MRALLITASDCSSQSRAHLRRLFESLAQQSASLEVILVQRGRATGDIAPGDGVTVHPIERPLATSLSEARNVGLAYAREHKLIDLADAVAFPDDDCVYPAGLLSAVGYVLASDADLVCGTYGPGRLQIDTERFPDESRWLTPSFVVRVVSSNNVFFAARVIQALGGFDERFGLGARLGSSEDTDYVLRALESGFVGFYSPRHVFVRHPYKSHRPAEYYVGNVAVLAKHVRGDRRIPLSLLHRLVVGARLLVDRQLPPRDYVRAVSAAVPLVLESVRGGGSRATGWGAET